MNAAPTLSPVRRTGTRICADTYVARPGAGWIGSGVVAIALTTGLLSSPAKALDGCLVLLCLAAPSWSAIPQCVPPINELFHDLARGEPFPTCAMSGAGNKARHRWARAPEFCPPQYTHVSEHEGGPTYTCEYAGAIAVNINGGLWARTWWRGRGHTSTEFSPEAKTQLGSWDTTYDDDYAAWVATQPPPCTTC